MSFAGGRGRAPTRWAALGLVAASVVLAASARAADDESPWTFSGRAGAVSNYVTRGLTQTWGGPAAQAEVEAEHDAGFYAGAFASNVSRRQFPGGGVELELWGGLEHEFARDRSLSVEGAYFAYPGANYGNGRCLPPAGCPSQTFDTFEGRLVARWDGFSTHFGYAFTDYFGASPQTGYQSSTRGTWYWDADVKYPLPIDESWELVAHAGYTRYSALFASPAGLATNPSYWDWRLGATKRFGEPLPGWQLGIYYTQASNRAFYDQTRSLVSDGTRDLGAATLIVEMFRTF